jgi:excisionase family DNA binding protein
MRQINSTLIENVSAEQILELMAIVIRKELEDSQKKTNSIDPDVLLTRAEACEFLKIEQTTLYNWIKAGKVPCYGIANRRFFKKSDLLNSLTLLKK